MIIPNLTYEAYCAIPGFNSSLMKIVAGESLLHARAYLDGLRDDQSDALDFGKSFHELLLRNNVDFHIRPDTYPAPAKHLKVKSGEINEGDPLPWNANAGECKKWLAERAPGHPVYSQKEAERILGMVAAVKADPEIAQYLDGQCELAVTADRRGVSYKCLVDLLPPRGPIIDFKKSKSANPRAFVAQSLKLGYHIQAALNLDVLAWNGDVRDEFWFVAVEAEPPFAIWKMKLKDTSPSIIRMGRTAYLSAVNLLQGAIKSGEWPGYPADIEPEALIPGWMVAEFEKT